MMKRSRFTQEQIIGVLKEHQAGATAADLCRKHGISHATFYRWRSKYGGMEVSDARKLKRGALTGLPALRLRGVFRTRIADFS
jgi:putative transposase